MPSFAFSLRCLSASSLLTLSGLPLQAVESSIELDWYGYIKADAIYDSTALNGLLGLQVDADAGDPGADGTFSLTANQSRLGLKLKGPSSEQYALSGQLEMDFYGSAAAKSYRGNNQPNPRMRHAFATLEFKDYGLSILAGQTWEIVSPGLSNVNSFGAAWKTGNIGFRQPQMRLTKTLEAGTTNWRVDAGLVDTAESAASQNADMPTFQARVGCAFPGLTDRPTVIGISGSYGSETVATTEEDQTSTIINVDFSIPLHEKLTLTGEIYTGENVDGSLGIGGYEIEEFGFWLNLKAQATEKLSLTAGYGAAMVENDQDLAAGNLEENSMLFLNAWLGVYASCKLGAELSHWESTYKGSDAVDNTRFMLSMLYSF